jgi:hypothetical protein
MKMNMGNLDRLVRAVIAAVVVALYLAGTLSGTLAIVLLVVSGIFLLTSLVGTCPLYSVLGIRTCSAKKAGG